MDGKAAFPRFKKFLANHQGVVTRTLWHYDDVSHTQGATEELKRLEIFGFSTPKPTRLIEKMLKVATDTDSIILDFFSGSATTAHAVMQLNAEDGGNRRFIMVQLPEVCGEKSEAFKAGYKNICEIGKERIRRAGKKIIESLAENEPSVDIGFKVFKLDSSNLKLWDDTPVAEDDIETLLSRMAGHIDGLKPDRSDEDLIYEILLKMGYPLTSSVAALDVNGVTVYSVDSNDMLICLQENITTEHIESMASLAPKKLVVAERALADNSAMSNAYYLLENRGIELKIV